MNKFKTIRQTSHMGILPEYRIRRLVSEGKCPGILSGNRFMVNVEALSEMLEKDSRRCMETSEGEGWSWTLSQLPWQLLQRSWA